MSLPGSRVAGVVSAVIELRGLVGGLLVLEREELRRELREMSNDFGVRGELRVWLRRLLKAGVL